MQLGLLVMRSNFMEITLAICESYNFILLHAIAYFSLKDLGINIEVRYSDSTELAIALIEEGKNSRAHQ